MNLAAVVAPVIGAVNPPVPGVLYRYTGATKNPDYTRTASYSQTPVTVQEQPLGPTDLRQLLAMNIQSVTRKAYLYGDIQGVNRASQLGGDMVSYSLAGTTRYWLVTAVLETWDQDGWCSVGLTEQVNPPS